MPDLGKQVGPLPLGAWVAVVGGSLAFLFYSRSHDSAPEEVAAGPDPGVGFGGEGAIGGTTPTNGGVNAPGAPTGDPTTNAQWSRLAFNWLVSDGTDGSLADR